MSIASATLLIRVFGMGMQVVVTARFGLGPSMDAYFIAAAVPALFAGALTYPLQASVVPVIVRARGDGDSAAVSSLFSTLLNLCFIAAIILTALMFVLRRHVIWILAPGADSLRLHLAATLAPVIFPALILTVVLGLLEAVLNAEGQFGWPAYAGLLVPLSSMVMVLIGGKSLGVVTLGIGTLIGLCLQTCAFIVRVRRAKISYRPILDWRNPALAAVMSAMWPLLLASCIVPISPVIDQIFASGLSAGSISALGYASKLAGVPIGVLFNAMGRATLPFFARSVAAGDMVGFKSTLRLYLWLTGIVVAIMTLVSVGLAHLVVQLLFQRGAFTSADTDHTAITFVGFALGFFPMSLGFLTAGAFSALRKTQVLLYTDVFTLLANAIFDAIFARFWQSFGIALATSMVYVCTMIIKMVLLRRTLGPLGLLAPPPELREMLRVLRSRRYLAFLRT